MKQTAIKISMISNIDNVVNDNTNNGEQLMTSLEVAQLTGKKHKDVLKAIRNMEPGWIHIAGRNFALGSYEDANKQLRPCYMLSKTETLVSSLVWTEKGRQFVLDMLN